MEQTRELQHWGIKGQKWGVRRFQNEDGSLTEEGKKRYMYAARSGKLDYKKLSDKDLDMINNRFNKENQFKRNVENYQNSKFSNQLKDAIINRIKNGSANKKKGESWMSDLLVKPIKKAIEDALKFDIKDDGKNDGDKEKREKKKKEATKKGEEFVKQVAKEDIRQLESEDRTGNATKPYSYTYYSGPRLMSGEGTVHSGISKNDASLSHHGIKGQKWGVRRFQNEDRTLTEAGKERYRNSSVTKDEFEKLHSLSRKYAKAQRKAVNKQYKGSYISREIRRKKLRSAVDALDDYGSKLANKMAKNDPDVAKALADYKNQREEDDKEWAKISDQKFIDSVGRNKSDPRSKSLRKYGDHYEFDGDGTEFWRKFANKRILERSDDAYAKYSDAIQSSIYKTYSSAMGKPISSVKSQAYYDTTRRMIDYMIWNMPDK